MRIIQIIIQKLACIVVLAGGAALAVFSVSGLYQVVIAQLPEPNPTLRVAIGCLAIALAVLALVPLSGRRRKARELRFEDESGTVTIQLDPIAASLNKTFNKVPVVKKGTVHLTPRKSADKTDVHADVHLLNPADASVRETTTQLKVYLGELARSVVGAEEIGNVSVNIINSETAELPAPTSVLSPSKAAAVAPAAQAIAELEPAIVEDEPEFAVAESVPEELVTYEESVQAAEEEEESLTGQADEETEPELAVAWDAADALPEESPVEDEPKFGELDAEGQTDTAFDSLVTDEHATGTDEERPASGG